MKCDKAGLNNPTALTAQGNKQLHGDNKISSTRLSEWQPEVTAVKSLI